MLIQNFWCYSFKSMRSLPLPQKIYIWGSGITQCRLYRKVYIIVNECWDRKSIHTSVVILFFFFIPEVSAFIQQMAKFICSNLWVLLAFISVSRKTKRIWVGKKWWMVWDLQGCDLRPVTLNPKSGNTLRFIGLRWNAETDVTKSVSLLLYLSFSYGSSLIIASFTTSKYSIHHF